MFKLVCAYITALGTLSHYDDEPTYLNLNYYN